MVTSLPKSPVNYIGGKAGQAKRIVTFIPEDTAIFVDAFGGGGHVTSAVAPSIERVFNDVLRDIPTFFLCLSQHKEELLRRIECMPYSRDLHNEILKWRIQGCPGPVTDIERSARWFFLVRTSFRGKIGAGYGYSRGKSGGGGTAGGFINAVRRLEEVAEFWRTVNVECVDFSELFRRYDSERTLFYLDPPYIGTEKEYPESGFGSDDHARLAELANAAEGRVMINYFDDPLLEKLYPKSKWKRKRVEMTVSSKIVSRGSANKNRRKAVLVYLLNYKMQG